MYCINLPLLQIDTFVVIKHPEPRKSQSLRLQILQNRRAALEPVKPRSHVILFVGSGYMGVVTEGTCPDEMKAGLGLMTVFLCLAAVAQLNDPDPLLWMAIYGIPGLLTLSAFISISIMSTKLWWCTCFGVFTVLLAFSILLITSNLKNSSLTWNLVATEEGRESAGLLIVLSWLAILLYSSSSQPQPRQGIFGKYMLLTFAVVPLASWIGYKYFLQDIVEIPEHCQGVL